MIKVQELLMEFHRRKLRAAGRGICFRNVQAVPGPESFLSSVLWSNRYFLLLGGTAVSFPSEKVICFSPRACRKKKKGQNITMKNFTIRLFHSHSLLGFESHGIESKKSQWCWDCQGLSKKEAGGEGEQIWAAGDTFLCLWTRMGDGTLIPKA